MTATLRHPATPLGLLLLSDVIRPRWAANRRTEMLQTETKPAASAPALLTGWISRHDLADALGLSVDTLGRWERRRAGPPCVRAGRKVLYRRRAVEDWLAAQEMPRAKTARGRT